MRRFNKELFQLFRELGIYLKYLDVREDDPEVIQFQREEALRIYEGKRVDILNLFYYAALDHAYGREKALSQPKA